MGEFMVIERYFTKFRSHIWFNMKIKYFNVRRGTHKLSLILNSWIYILYVTIFDRWDSRLEFQASLQSDLCTCFSVVLVLVYKRTIRYLNLFLRLYPPFCVHWSFTLATSSSLSLPFPFTSLLIRTLVALPFPLSLFLFRKSRGLSSSCALLRN